MWLFKNTKTRNTVIYSICGVIFTASIATICVVLWPKEETPLEPPKTTSHEEPQPNADGSYYETVSCKELAKITGENNCQDTNNTPSYSNPYTYTYTPSETTQNTAPATPQYNVPEYTPTPTPEPDCNEHHNRYYATYQQKVSQATQSYNTALSNASIECAGSGSSFGGCNSMAERKLKAQLDSNIQTYKSEYKTSMASAGCNSSEYVSF